MGSPEPISGRWADRRDGLRRAREPIRAAASAEDPEPRAYLPREELGRSPSGDISSRAEGFCAAAGRPRSCARGAGEEDRAWSPKRARSSPAKRAERPDACAEGESRRRPHGRAIGSGRLRVPERPARGPSSGDGMRRSVARQSRRLANVAVDSAPRWPPGSPADGVARASAREKSRLPGLRRCRWTGFRRGDQAPGPRCCRCRRCCCAADRPSRRRARAHPSTRRNTSPEAASR
jgi:hypothetical protein